MYFGIVAIVAKEVRANVWMLRAYSVDNVENLGPAFDLEPVTVKLSELFGAVAAMAQAAGALQHIQFNPRNPKSE